MANLEKLSVWLRSQNTYATLFFDGQCTLKCQTPLTTCPHPCFLRAPLRAESR